MKSNSLIQELETHFQSFIKEKDYDKFCRSITSYFQFIEDTYPFNEIAQRLFSSRSSPTILHKVSGLYQMFVHNKKDPRFSISSQSVGGSGLSTFHSLLKEKAKQLGLNTKETKFLLLKDDIFTYNGNKMAFGSDTHVYRCLRTIYEYSGGKSCEISYKTLCDSLRNWGNYKLKSEKQLKELLTKYISSEKSELGMKLSPVENNGLKLIDTRRGIGIVFNNG